MARRNGKKHPQASHTSMHPAVVEMQATFDKIGKQLSLEDFLDLQVKKLRVEQQRNAAVQEAFRELSIDQFDPRSEESKLDEE